MSFKVRDWSLNSLLMIVILSCIWISLINLMRYSLYVLTHLLNIVWSLLVCGSWYSWVGFFRNVLSFISINSDQWSVVVMKSNGKITLRTIIYSDNRWVQNIQYILLDSLILMLGSFLDPRCLKIGSHSWFLLNTY